MISRVAESCFWLLRYLERVESTARLLGVNRSFVLDLDLPELEHWRPLIIVSGEQRRFSQRHSAESADDGEAVQEYLTWNEENPVSIYSSTRWARENARMIREVVSLDMWEGLNGFWHWLRGGTGRRLFRTNRDRFYASIVESCRLFLGLTHTTMLHEPPFDFMLLGMFLERAGQTARILDLKHHAVGQRSGSLDAPEAAAQWSVTLQSCGAAEVFLQRHGGVLDGPAVVEFLMLEPRFPRSVTHCLDQAATLLREIRPPRRRTLGERSAGVLDALRERLKGRTAEQIIEDGLHRELTHVIDAAAVVCDAIRVDYFDPPLSHLLARGRNSAFRTKKRSRSR